MFLPTNREHANEAARADLSPLNSRDRDLEAQDSFSACWAKEQFDSHVAQDCHEQIPIQLKAMTAYPELTKQSEKVYPQQPDSYKLKKDAMYKPLLRKFRTFYRKLMDGIGLAKGCHHWSSKRTRKQVWAFMHFLELPACFMDERSFCSMAIILFPTMNRTKGVAKNYLPEIDTHLAEIKQSCYDVFQENNMKKRRAFFGEPLLQHLWKLFVYIKPDVLIQHLRRTRSHPNAGEARYKMLLDDIQVTEKLCNFKIIPDNALGDHVITRLTPLEFE